MSSFRSRLAIVVRMRERERDLVRRELADALQEHELANNRYREAVAKRSQILDRIRIDSASGQSVSAERILDLQADERQLKLQVNGMLQAREIAELRMKQIRQRLVEADQKVKAVEKLIERRRDEWMANELRKQELLIGDQWSAHQATRADHGSDPEMESCR